MPMSDRRWMPLVGLLLVIGCVPSTRRMSALCQETTNLSQELCDCMAEKAETDLSPNARKFLVATMEKDSERASELRGQLTLDEAAKAGLFFVSAPASCVAGRE